jgi:CRISPR-associated protein Cas1
MVEGMLDGETRKAVVGRVMERLTATEVREGKRYQVRSIIQMQARRLASFLRGEGTYKAFSFKW